MNKGPLPKGKLNCRFRQMRGVWQCFAGNTYLGYASGDTPEEAIEAIKLCYIVPVGSEVMVHWGNDKKLKMAVK